MIKDKDKNKDKNKIIERRCDKIKRNCFLFLFIIALVYITIGIILFVFAIFYTTATSGWDEQTYLLASKQVKPYDCVGEIHTLEKEDYMMVPVTYECNTTNYQYYFWFVKSPADVETLACETSNGEKIVTSCKCCAINNSQICENKEVSRSNFDVCNPIISPLSSSYEDYVVGQSYNIWKADNGLLFLHKGNTNFLSEYDYHRESELAIKYFIVGGIGYFLVCIMCIVLIIMDENRK